MEQLDKKNKQIHHQKRNTHESARTLHTDHDSLLKRDSVFLAAVHNMGLLDNNYFNQMMKQLNKVESMPPKR